jgi:DNA-binding transcriptional LysR family regulator
MKLMRSVRDEHPHLELEIDTAHITPQVVRMARSGAIDLGLVSGPVRDGHLIRTPIGEAAWGVLVPEAHPFFGMDLLYAQQLEGQRLVLVGSTLGWPFRRLVKDLLTRFAVTPRDLTVVSDSLTMLAYVTNGLGLGFTVNDAAWLPPGTQAVPIAKTNSVPIGAIWRISSDASSLGIVLRSIERNFVPSGAAVAALGSNNRNDNEVYLE